MDAGVSLDRADEIVKRIKPHVKRTASQHSISLAGGFAAGVALDLTRWREPVLVSSADGVGTKIALAAEHGRLRSAGIDAVAMCVNDLLVCGAEPLFLLDYIATGELDVDAIEQLVAGIADGCEISGCSLVGGETAEMPGMYQPGDVDVACTAVGVVERSRAIDPTRAQVGDQIVGFASSGPHSNGYSLIRSVLPDPDDLLLDRLLAPTTIYAGVVKQLLTECDVHALAHITGGGIPGNLSRVIQDHLTARIDTGAWSPPPVFDAIQRAGRIDPAEMFRVFNMGIGMIAIVPPAHVDTVLETARSMELGAWNIGELARRDETPVALEGRE
jgi:phosphoribosylformylglycinamidine cyclo-ligase